MFVNTLTGTLLKASRLKRKRRYNLLFNPFRTHSDLIQVIYESYWSPSQVKARSHPNMLATQSWMNQLYRADADQKSKTLCNGTRTGLD
jgi:hypothetical protein